MDSEITLKEYVDRRIVDVELAATQRFDAQQLAVKDALINQEKAVNAALLASEKAIIKAEISTEKRFDNVNESMTKVASQSADFLPRAEYAANHKALDDKIEVINNSLSKSYGSMNLYATHADVAAAVDGITATIKPVLEYVARQQGQNTGSQLTMNRLYATLAAFATVLGIIIIAADRLINN